VVLPEASYPRASLSLAIVGRMLYDARRCRVLHSGGNVVRVAINALFWNQPATGSGQYVRHLAAHLANQAPDIELLLVGPRGQTILRPPLGAQTVSAGSTALSAYPRTARNRGADVLHVPYFAPPRYSRVPVVVTIHDLIPLLLRGYRGGPLVRAYTAWVARAARNADRVLTDSRAAARDIAEHLNLPAGRVQVVYLAADEAFRPAGTASDAQLLLLRRRLSLPEHYLLYLGGFDRRKQVPELLEAYARTELPDNMPLVIAGRLPAHDSAFGPDPRPLAQALGLAGRIVFTGWVDESDKPALYRGARAFLFPSVYEGFGLPVLESLACGTPVIACHGSSLEEVVGPGGLLVDASDRDALAAAIHRLVTDDVLRDSLARAGLSHAATFSWDITARETARAYREVLGG
jgi:glycosyltransferase involved in cell wall biosynthesis